MITKRLILVIGLLTLLGFVAAWQQIQTTRFGYKISELEQCERQLVEQNLSLSVQLARLRSPESLLVHSKSLDFVYPQEYQRLNQRKVQHSVSGGTRLSGKTTPADSLRAQR